MPKKVEWSSPYDSGYASDIIYEEEEEEGEGYESDETLSPRACRMPPKSWSTVSRQSSSSTCRSQKRDSSWKPNLKHELTRYDSMESTASKDADDEESLYSPQSPEDMSPLDRSISPERKNSTLLHPSSPVESFTDDQYARDFTMGEPSPALLSDRMDVSDKKRVTIISIAEATTPPPSRMSTSTPLLLRPRLPPRKPSTLLHPSSPSSDSPATTPTLTLPTLTLPSPTPEVEYPFPLLTHTPPTPLPTDTKFQRRVSVLHSALSEDEWEEPLHSSQSDEEYESEDDDTESLSGGPAIGLPNSQVAKEAVAVAKPTGRKARASRISFHGHHLRILSD